LRPVGTVGRWPVRGLVDTQERRIGRVARERSLTAASGNCSWRSITTRRAWSSWAVS
jgi:hypothetical protein